jgi:uncharacterized repeat protein (TIGR03803 family)
MKNLFAMAMLMICANLSTIAQVQAQTFKTLYSFSGNNGEGDPSVGLSLSGSVLYGTSAGAYGQIYGAVFAINVDGSGFTNLYNNFRGVDSGGFFPRGVIVSGNTLYGTIGNGGSGFAGYNGGYIFSISTNGTSFTRLYNFSGGNDGGQPSRLMLSGNMLYGTAITGGLVGDGTVFAFDTVNSKFAILHSFTATSGGFVSGGVSYGTNSDGANPYASLILSSNILYGTTQYGGGYGKGTVFAINTNGMNFTNLYSFTGGNDGNEPRGSLILSSNILYGTALYGGTFNNGTVFSLNIDGTGYTNLHSFTNGNDGANPIAGLILSGNTLYGTATIGGTGFAGTVFTLSTDGTGYTNLYNFTGGDDGSEPYGSLILSENILYGTTFVGGVNDSGTVFSFALPLPQLTITLSETNVVLTWPANASDFVLQSTTNLVSAVWTSTNGQNTVTNSISDQQRFYRLSQSSP